MNKLFSMTMLAFGCLMASCGQAQVSDSAQAAAPIATSPAAVLIAPPVTSPIAAAPTPPDRSEPAIVAAEPESMPEPMPEAVTMADHFNAEWQRIRSQPCDNMDTTQGNVLYRICVENTGRSGGGDSRVISASSSSVSEAAGVEYWFAENGNVNAIFFYHSGETFVFNPENGVLAVSIISPTEVESVFSDEVRDRLETQAREGGALILNKFRGEAE
jgi:hypothetical protein